MLAFENYGGGGHSILFLQHRRTLEAPDGYFVSSINFIDSGMSDGNNLSLNSVLFYTVLDINIIAFLSYSSSDIQVKKMIKFCM